MVRQVAVKMWNSLKGEEIFAGMEVGLPVLEVISREAE